MAMATAVGCAGLPASPALAGTCGSGGGAITIATSCTDLGITTLGAAVTVAAGVTVSDPSGAYSGIWNNTGAVGTSLTNYGTVTSNGGLGIYNGYNHGLYSSPPPNEGTITTLLNLGTITGPGLGGVENQSTIGTLTNLGTITARYWSIYNAGTLTNLNNAQGGNSPLVLQGALPANYNVLVASAATYGELVGHYAGGLMNFGIYAGSVLAPGIYAGVLQNLPLSDISSGLTGTYGGYTWSLVTDGVNVDLVVQVPVTSIGTGSTDLASSVGGTLLPILDGGTLIADQDNASNFTITGNGGTVDAAGGVHTFFGAFSDSTATSHGVLIIADSGAGGAVVLTGANTFSGGIQVDPGATLSIPAAAALGTGTLNLIGSATVPSTLAVTGTTTITNPITVAGDPVFAITAGTTTTIAAAIADASPTTSGDVVLSGGGTLLLSAANTYTGPTTVNAGTLQVDGSITSPVSVAAAGTLRGHGRIAGNVSNSGTVFPGGTIGILTVAGTYAQSSVGLLAIEVTPSAIPGVGYDQLQVTGSARLAGSLNVIVDNGSYAIGTRYDILHAAGGVSGTFAHVAYSAAFAPYIDPLVSYQANDVYVQLQPLPAAFDSGRVVAANSFVTNQSLFAAMDAPLGTDAIDGTDPGAADPSAPDRGNPRQGAWVRGLGGFGSANGFDFNSGGFVIGKGFAVTPTLSVGASASSLFTTTSGNQSSVGGTSVGLSGYGIYTRGRLRMAIDMGVGALSDRISRNLASLGIAGRATSSGMYDDAAARVQYTLGNARYFAIPDLEAAYLHTDTGHATETGAGVLNLRYDGIGTDLGRVTGGMTAGLRLPGRLGTLVPWVRLGGFGSVGNTRVANVETLGVVSTSEAATAAPAAAWTAGLGVEVIGKSAWRGGIRWGGAYGGGTSAETFAADVRYMW
jgi:autotransporter-associated beta strand protein